MLNQKLIKIECLLKEQTPDEQEIKKILGEVMKALEKDSLLLSEIQQCLWLSILKMLKHRSLKTEDIVRKWCGFDYLYPQHQQSFEEDSPVFIKENAEQFNEFARAIWTRVDGSDTGPSPSPSLIGIKSDIWKMGLFED